LEGLPVEKLLSLEHARQMGDSVLAWTGANLLTVWAAYQVAFVVGSFLLALIAQRASRRRIEGFVSNLETSPRMRTLLRNVLGLVGTLVLLFCLLVITAVVRIRYTALSPNIVNLVLSLATAWLVVRLVTGAMTDRNTARAVGLIVWGLAALNIVGLLDPIMLGLDTVGMSLGDSRITLLTVVKGLALLAILMWAALFAVSLLSQRLQTSPTITGGTQVLITKLVKFALIALALVVSLSTIGVNLAALAVFAGALGVGIGIGLQHQVSNLLSGLFLLLDKSIKPGDVIEVGESYGWVREMSARYVGIVTRDNKEILIPNDSFVQNQVVNWSHTDRKVRLEVKFGVAYSSDPHAVRKLAVSAAQQAKRISLQPDPVCHLTGFGESSIDFVLRFWISDPEAGVTNIKGEVLLALWDAFKASKIAIPFPHRYVILAGNGKDERPEKE